MAAKKFIIVAGQDNALEVGDAPSWEDLHPYVALRNAGHNARTQAPQTSGAVYELPYTFPGGEQLNRYGDGSFGTWQDAHLGGRTVPAVRFLTHYNPSAAYTNVGTGSASQYPGTCAVVASPDPTSTTFATDVRWQYDPEGIVLTRHSTATTHTIAANASWAAGSTVTVSPPLVPPPVVGELFDYQIVGGFDSTSDDEVMLCSQFGGSQDIGSTADAVATSSAVEAGKHAVIVTGEEDEPVTFTLRSRPIAVGQAVSFSKSVTQFAMTAYDEYDCTLTGDSSYTIFGVGDAVMFSTAGSAPTGVDKTSTFYVSQILDHPNATTWRLQVSATLGGASLLIESGGGSATGITGLTVVSAPHPDVTETTTHYVTRVKELDREVELTSTAWAGGHYTITLAAHTFLDGEFISMVGDVPPGIDEFRRYYVEVVDANTIQIRKDRDGALIAHDLVGGDVTVTREDSMVQFHVSATRGGAETLFTGGSEQTGLRTSTQMRMTIQEVFRGSLTGATITCTSGGNVGESKTLADIYTTSGGKAFVVCDEDWTVTPAAGDIYTIQPPSSLEWSKWAMFLPWSPFEGRAPLTGPESVTFSAEGAGSAIVATIEGQQPDVGTAVSFYTGGNLPRPLSPGVRYFVHSKSGEDSFTLKESYTATEAITLAL